MGFTLAFGNPDSDFGGAVFPAWMHLRQRFDVPTLIIHGDGDQIVPIGAAALNSAKLVKNAILKIYPGRTPRSHGHAQIPDQCRPAGIP